MLNSTRNETQRGCANLLAWAYHARAAARHEHDAPLLGVQQCIYLRERYDGRFAGGEAERAWDERRPQAAPAAAQTYATSLMPFVGPMGSLPEDLAADLASDEGQGVRAVCEHSYAQMAGAWLDAALGLQLGPALAADADASLWGARLSHLFGASRALHPGARQMLRNLGAAQPTASDVVQIIALVWRSAALDMPHIDVRALAGGTHMLEQDQRFALGCGVLGEQTVLGASMPAIAACVDVTIGPIGGATLEKLNTLPQLQAQLHQTLGALLPAHKDVRIYLRLQQDAVAPLQLGPTAASPARLGTYSWLGMQPADARYLWLDTRAQHGAQNNKDGCTP